MLMYDDIAIFLKRQIGVLVTDNGKDYFLRGELKKVTPNSILLSSPQHGDSIIPLSEIKKMQVLKGDLHA